MNWYHPLFDFPVKGVTFSLLFIAISLVFLEKKQLAILFASVALCTALYSGQMQWVALPTLITLAVALYFHKKKSLAVIAHPLIILSAILLSAHIAPGFNNWLWHQDVQFSESSIVSRLYFNLDKGLVGLLLGFFLYNTVNKVPNYSAATMTITTLTALSLIFCVSWMLGLIRWQPHYHPLFMAWLVKMLFLTIVAEEMFFRYYLQGVLLKRWITNAHYLVLLSGLIFGLLHFLAGWQYAIVATIAGTLYAFLYQRTQHIGWSITAHLLLNSIHFLLFTYPLAD